MAKHVRWCFDATNWNPTKEQWVKLSAAIPRQELEQINKFTFKDNAKHSLIGQVMIRAFLSKSLDKQSNKIDVNRNQYGRPQLSEQFSKSIDCDIDFNVSHSGDYCVLAGYQNPVVEGLRLGVDVTQIISKKTKQELDRFLSLMSERQFLKSEWKNVEDAVNDRDKCIQFTRLWCLKESFIKAIGEGLHFSLNRIGFVLDDGEIKEGILSSGTTVKVDGLEDNSWKFLETKLDGNHLVAIGYNCDRPIDLCQTIGFSRMGIEDLMGYLTPMYELDDNNWIQYMNKLVKK